MNLLITAYAPLTPPSAILSRVKTERTKTLTKLVTQFGMIDYTNYYGKECTQDIAILGLQGQPITQYTVIVEGCRNIGRLTKRSTKALFKVGISIDTVMDWDDRSGMITLHVSNGTGMDYPHMVEMIQRLVLRASGYSKVKQSQFNLHSFKQTIALIYDVKKGVESAQDMVTWLDIREMVQLEELRQRLKEQKRALTQENRERRDKYLKQKNKHKKKGRHKRPGPPAQPWKKRSRHHARYKASLERTRSKKRTEKKALGLGN